MAEVTHFGHKLLLSYEDRIKTIREINKEISVVANELQEYFNENSNVGLIQVAVIEATDLRDPEWTIKIGEMEKTIHLDSIQHHRVKEGRFGEEIDFDKPVKPILQSIISNVSI